MKNIPLHFEQSGNLILGEIINFSPTSFKVKIIYPYYGIFLTANPKMCMLFSEKTINKLGIKVLKRCYALGKNIDKKSKDIYIDFSKLQQKLKTLNSTNPQQKKDLLQDFQFYYLNFLKPIPELKINPLPDLIQYLEKYLIENQDISSINPKTSFHFSEEEIKKMLENYI